jgi:hypothetical protein
MSQTIEAQHEDGPEGDGDTCPVCGHFNSPPADDLCEHACGWEWDGQFEPLRRGEVFAAALRELATEVQHAQDDPDRQHILQWLSRADQERQQLIELAPEGPKEALTELADAKTGDGWSTSGMVDGSGHTVYVEQPSRLDHLAARCRSVAQACSVRIQTEDSPGITLESLRPQHTPQWEFVASGSWAEDVYHSGHVAYLIAPAGPGTWIMEAVARNAVLDGVTEEDVEEGRLNDDQIQAMWGMTLEEAQEAEHREIVAACSGVGEAVAPREVAALLYWAVCESGGREITEPDDGEALVDVGEWL